MCDLGTFELLVIWTGAASFTFIGWVARGVIIKAVDRRERKS